MKLLELKEVSNTRKKITSAFAELRWAGFLCKRDYMCCMSCMRAALAKDVESRTTQGVKTVGVVSYHQQDHEGLMEGRNFCIAFSESGTPDSLTNTEVGERLKSALESHGLTTQWDGTPEHRVEVIQNLEPEIAVA